jgi:hypothetical protein
MAHRSQNELISLSAMVSIRTREAFSLRWTAAVSPGVAGDQDFGEEHIAFNVPEFAADIHARVNVKLDGRSFQFNPTVHPQKKWTLFLVPQYPCSRMAALTMASSAELWPPASLPSNGPDHTCPKRTPGP